MLPHLSLTTVPVDALEETFRQIIRSELSYSRQAEQNDRMISPAEVCNLFTPAISKTTLAKWTREGALKAYRMGGRVFYRHGEVMQGMQSLKRYGRNQA